MCLDRLKTDAILIEHSRRVGALFAGFVSRRDVFSVFVIVSVSLYIYCTFYWHISIVSFYTFSSHIRERARPTDRSVWLGCISADSRIFTPTSEAEISLRPTSDRQKF